MCGNLQSEHEKLTSYVEAYSVDVQFKQWLDDTIKARYQESEGESEQSSEDVEVSPDEAAEEPPTDADTSADEPAPEVDETIDGESWGMDGFDFSNMFDESTDEVTTEGQDDDDA